MMANSRDLSGKKVGAYTLEHLIGRGGMGAVYLAQQAQPERQVAIKLLLPGAAISSEQYDEFLARFKREANVIAKLEHLNIIPIYEYGEQDGLAYLVMPYLPGAACGTCWQNMALLPCRRPLSISSRRQPRSIMPMPEASSTAISSRATFCCMPMAAWCLLTLALPASWKIALT
jgi:serine/threonine protein kinase